MALHRLELQIQVLKKVLAYTETRESTSKACERLVRFVTSMPDPLIPKEEKKDKRKSKKSKGEKQIQIQRVEPMLPIFSVVDTERMYTLITLFDDPLWLKIFKYLDTPSLLPASMVCKRWNIVCKDVFFGPLWEEIRYECIARSRVNISTKNIWKKSSPNSRSLLSHR